MIISEHRGLCRITFCTANDLKCDNSNKYWNRSLHWLFALNCLFSHRLQKTSTPRVTGLCEGNPPVTGGFPSQRASIAGNVSIWWLHHEDEYEHNWSVQWIFTHMCHMPPRNLSSLSQIKVCRLFVAKPLLVTGMFTGTKISIPAPMRTYLERLQLNVNLKEIHLITMSVNRLPFCTDLNLLTISAVGTTFVRLVYIQFSLASISTCVMNTGITDEQMLELSRILSLGCHNQLWILDNKIYGDR